VEKTVEQFDLSCRKKKNKEMSLDEFVAMTGADANISTHFLEMANFDLNTAMELYFSNMGNDMGNDMGGRIGDASAGSDHGATDIHTAAAMASINDGFIHGNDQVRAPDAIKKQRLIGGPDIFDLPITGQGVGRPPPVPSAFMSGKDFKPANEKEKILSELFMPPTDLIENLDFDSLVDKARDNNKWVLLNIQQDSCFQSHVLNRDLWSDECIRAMVKSCCLFWQHLDSSQAGQQVAYRYKLTDFPHISIIDPRTGAIVWRNDGEFRNVRMIAEKLQDFIGQNEYPGVYARKLSIGGSNSRNSNSSISSSSSNSNSRSNVRSNVRSNSDNKSRSSSKGTFDYVQDTTMTEDEALQAALKMSLGDNPFNSSSPSVMPIDSNSISKSHEPILPGYCVGELCGYTADVLSLQKSSNDESAILRVAFKMPDGKRLIHTFDGNTATVRIMLAYIAKQLNEAGVPSDAHFEVGLSMYTTFSLLIFDYLSFRSKTPLRVYLYVKY